MPVTDLDGEILAVGTALGVVHQGTLNTGFFSDPLGHLRTIVSDSEQRSALIGALSALLPPVDDPPPADAGGTTTRHPIVHTTHGTLALSVTQSGAADDPTVVVGLSGTAVDPGSGCRVDVDLPLVQGDDLGAHVVAASPAHPMAVTAAIPIGWTRPGKPIGLDEARLSALVVAPPDVASSRIVLELSGLDVGAGPQDLLLDPADLGDELASTLTTLLLAGLQQAAGGSDLVASLVANLPTILGLDGQLPALPIGHLISDAGAFRAWLGSLVTSSVAGRPALIAWLDSLGRLLGAPPLASALTALPNAANPLVIPLVDGGDDGFGVAVELYVETPAASTTPELHVELRAGVAGPVAALRADAELLVVPLGGNTATTALASAQLVVESVGPLWPRGAAADSALRVGVARGGLRYAAGQVVPVLELDGVHVDLPGVTAKPLDFDRLDLTAARTLAAAANATVQDFLTAQLGSGTLGTAVLGLLGLDGADLDAFAAFANDPLRAIGAYHRARLAAGQYGQVAQQIVALFGTTTAVTGSGTAADPWFAPLDGVAPTAPSTLHFGVAVWVVPASDGQQVHVGLRLASAPPSGRPGWSAQLAVDLATFSFPNGAAVRAGFLGGVDLDVTIALPQADGAAATADTLQATLGWAPGAKLRADLSITGVTVDVDGTGIALGTIALPDALDAATIETAWPAVRGLLGRAASSWGGGAGAAVAALLGLDDSLAGLPDTWPPLELPNGGIEALLSDPLSALRGRLAALVAAAVADSGAIPLRAAFDVVSRLLAGAVPDRPRPDVLPLPAGVPLTGSGTYDDPWALALTDPGTPFVAQPIDLLAWLEPGPPPSWAAAVRDVLGADAPEVTAVLNDLPAWLPGVRDALAGLDADRVAAQLSAVAGTVDGTDGLVAAAGPDDLPAGLAAGPVVTAAHHLVPQAADAVAAVTAHLAAHAAGLPVLLVGPSFAPSDVWDALVAATPNGTAVRVDLRVPGTDPARVDLGAVTAGSHYLVDLADDGTPSLADLTARLDRVVERVRTLTGAASVALVGHSTAALAVTAYAAAAPAACAALVTLAAPFVPVDPATALAGDAASGVRLVSTLAAGALSGTPALAAAFGHLAGALEGYTAGAPTPYPTAAFTRILPPGTDVSAVPALALGARLEVPVVNAVAAALDGALDAALPPDPDAAPTHVSWGLRARVDLGAGNSGPQVDARARLDLGRVRLADGAAEPEHPAHRLAVDVLVSDPSGWLVGSAGTGAPLATRLRAARLTASTVPGGATDFDVALYDAAVSGAALPVAHLGDPQAPQLLRALADGLAGAAADTTSDAYGLLQLLQGIGLASYDPVSATAAVYADAVAAIRTDPQAWLSARLPAVLDAAATTLGLTADPAVSGAPRRWRRALGVLPVELVVTDRPWTVGVQTTGAGWSTDAVQATLSAAVRLTETNAPVTLAGSLAAAGVTLTFGPGSLSVAAAPALDPITLVPAPAGSAVRDPLLHALATTGLAAAVSAAVQDAVGGVVPIGSLLGLFSDPAGWLADLSHLGAAGGGFDVGRVRSLLDALAAALGLPPAAGRLHVTDGLEIVASTTGGALQLGLEATALPVGSEVTLDADLAIAVAADRSVTPAGSATLTLPLAAGWPTLAITAAAGPTGLTLSVTPGSGNRLELLPHFPGLWDLLAGVQALLPGVLDALVSRIQGAGASPVLDSVLALVDALGLRSGNPAHFGSAPLANLVTSVGSGASAPSAQQLADLVDALLPASAPITVGTSGAALTVDVTALPVPGTVHLSASAPGGGTPPDIGIQLAGVTLGPVVLALALAETGGAFTVQASLGIDLAAATGFAFTPALHVQGGAAPLSVDLAPLGSSSPLRLVLAPAPAISPGRAQLGDLVERWIVPIVARAALEAADTLLETPLWTGGPTAHALLRTAGLVQDVANTPRLVDPLPDPTTLLRGLLAAAGSVPIPVTSELSLAVHADGTWVGLAATGSIDIPAGDFLLSVLLGSPDVPQWASPPPGLTVMLLDTAGPSVRPAVQLGGVGLRIAKNSGNLVDSDEIRIQAIRAMLQAGIDLSGAAPTVNPLHGGVEIEKIGLPLGGASNPSNPIAASLLKPSGGGSGDDQPADPPSDLTVVSSDGGLVILINSRDAEQPFYVDVHKTFGPLHIDRIGLAHKMLPAGDGVGALVDGGVSAGGLTVDVVGLELDIPLKHPAELDQWQVDLAGLAVSFSAGPVSIAGGLLKSIQSGTVEYDGQLSVQVGPVGLSAIGAYSKPTEGGDTYTSLFAVVVIDAPLGGPPYLFVTGLAGGAGYNRQLVVPNDPSQIPSFPLVAVFDTGTGGDPMRVLRQMSAAMPARRGSYWVAAGVKFTTFELLHTKAMAYVALDRGFEIGLIGLMTMALPTPDAAIVSVELALLARYSSTDELLAIRAQLTNNSWLISRDCQLTGGFAFYAWFGDDPQVLLTIGGYGPYWQITPGDPHQYPVVPEVGFHWAVSGGIVVKGGTYFALTPHQLAFGGHLEASYDIDPIRVWFMVWLDVELQWDPLHYHFDAGVSIGASFHFTIDLLFTSITINITISLGASVVVDGPPLHGSVTVELEIASVTVDFGDNAPQNYLPWSAFVAKYAGLPAPSTDAPTDATSGSSTAAATVWYGQLSETRPDGSAPQPKGTNDAPWQVLPEFGLTLGSKVPLARVGFANATVTSPATSTFDLPAMGPAGTGFTARLDVRLEPWNGTTAGGAVTPVNGMTASIGNFPLSTWATVIPPDTNSAALVSSPTMIPALSGVTLDFPATIVPSAGRPNIPISTLVEEAPATLALPFTAAGVRAPAFTMPAAAASAARPRSARAARLEAVLTAPGTSGASAVRGHAVGVGLHQRLLDTSTAHRGGEFAELAPGESHVWRVAPGARLQTATDVPVRAVVLSPVGRVLADSTGTGLDVALPELAARVVVGAASPARGPWGWSTGSLLHQVGAATALGPGCCVLLPRPVTAPAPHPVERQVTAARLLSGLPGVQTVLPAETRQVVVVVDRADARAADDLVVACEHLGPAVERVVGWRRVLAYPVDGATGAVAVSVASGRAWRVAAVYGLAADADDDLLARLLADPYLPVPVPHLAVAGSPDVAAYRITPDGGADSPRTARGGSA